MKKLQLFLLILFVLMGFFLFEKIANTQEQSQIRHFTKEKNKNCVTIELISDSNSYSLENNKPISVVVKIENKYDSKVKLVSHPIFEIERVGISESDKSKLIPGNYYVGRIDSKQKRLDSKNIVLGKDEVIEFKADIASLQVKDSYSSINFWGNILKSVKKGDYKLKSTAYIKFLDKDSEKSKGYSSNEISLSYE